MEEDEIVTMVAASELSGRSCVLRATTMGSASGRISVCESLELDLCCDEPPQGSPAVEPR
jgi:hypothetical protein